MLHIREERVIRKITRCHVCSSKFSLLTSKYFHILSLGLLGEKEVAAILKNFTAHGRTEKEGVIFLNDGIEMSTCHRIRLQ